MTRLVVPAPTTPVLRLPWPDEVRLSIPAPQALRLILPGDLIPVVPGVAAGSVVGEATVAGVVTHVSTTAAGSVEGMGYVVEATASVVAKAAGAMTGEATVSGTALVPAAGSVEGEATITGTAVAKLAGTVTATAAITGTATAALRGTVSAAAAVTGTAAARAKAAGTVAGAATVSGTAVRSTIPMGMDKVGSQSGIVRNVWTLVTSWGVRAGRPDTVIASNGLQVKAGTYDIDGLITYVASDRRRWVRVYQNSTLLWEASIGSTFVTSIPITGTGLNSVVCAENDLLTVQVMNDGGNDAVAGGVNTYLTATPV